MENDLQNIQRLIDTVLEFFVNYSFQVIGAVLILIVSLFVGKWLSKLVIRVCEKREMDTTLTHFIASIAKFLVMFFAIIIALSKFGITIAPFIAAIGAVAFGATYAIQGPLSNYAAGFTIIISRSFIVGDTINVAGEHGVVEEVKLAYTRLITEDGVKIIIPNKHIVGEILQNSFKNRIVESRIGISYHADAAHAIQTISNTLNTIDTVSQNPIPQIGIDSFDDSAVTIEYRYWVPTQKFIQTKHLVNLAVYQAVQNANIAIPFPQREITIINPDKSE